MPEPRGIRLLSALLPGGIRRDVFEPAVHDARARRAFQRTSRPGRDVFFRQKPGTTLSRWLFAVRIVLIFLDCWRLAPAEITGMLLHDVRHALRLLVREPGFTLAAVLTLALGVGGNLAVFSVVNAVLLRPLPYAEADRLFIVKHRDTRTGISKEFVAVGDFVDLRAGQQAFESLAGYGGARSTLYGPAEPFDVRVLQATGDLARTLGLKAELGRTFEDGDAKPGAAPVMMISHDVWQTRFAGDAAIVGRSLRLGTAMREIVGVMPPGFRFPANARTDAMVPLPIPATAPAERKSGWTFAVARLRSGVTAAQATADLHTIAGRMAAAHPVANEGSDYFAVPLRDALVGETRSALLLLLGAVALVLLIACANVANLLVARALGRRTEMAVRVALGAGRGRIVVQMLAESVVLSAIAGATALACAWWSTPALARLVPASLNLAELGPIAIDRKVIAFALGVTALTSVLFGLFTALTVRIDSATAALVNPGRVSGSPAARRASSALIVAEVSLAIVLLSGAGLFIRSFTQLMAVEPGFDTHRVLTMDIALPADRYRDPEACDAFFKRAFAALESTNLVTSAGAAAVTPLTGNNWSVPFERDDRRVPAGERPPDVGWQSASAGYFRALQIPLLDGRLFGPQDTVDGAPVVIISRAIQDQFFPGERAVGKRVMVGPKTSAEIVGVVGDIRRAALTDRPRADMYFPFEQDPSRATTLFLRTPAEPLDAAAAVRTTLRSIEPLVAIRDTGSLEAIAADSVQTTRLALTLLSVFAGTALILAAVGIYGVMAYTVRQRTREIGTRLALGAPRRSILQLVLGDAARLAGIGTVVGLVVSWRVATGAASMLYATSPLDPLALVGASLVLFAVALVAGYLPARRAMRLDPVKSLAGQ